MKLKIGIVGFKDVGKAHYSELRRLNKFDVCGIYDKDGASEFSRVEIYGDFSKFIDEAKPEIIVICVDESEILATFNECVKFVKNIIIATPIFKSINDIREIKYNANVNKINVYLAFNSIFNQTITSLKRAICRDDEIYSVDIFHTDFNVKRDIISGLCVFDIYLAKFITNSENSGFSYAFLSKNNQINNTHINFKTKNQILISIINSISSPILGFNIRVSTSSGVYFADMISFKLHQINPNGQINLKVNSDDSEIKMLYENFYEFMQNGEKLGLVSLDEMIKIKELFV
ncbi:hypothetical protein [Campylobacter gastrosuis]|uniref:Oxidoreductase, Gfo/Idh/MocA family n=1 Tax=Campylobacter gastrosuis TaxID=2974576 RepID=A0ABT7HTF9_9BACT|nr:hypothetical protein [Campylobacter gastrosuis]MDL0089659.1 hypothetical protein [Campylobacter gastrosuis]